MIMSTTVRMEQVQAMEPVLTKRILVATLFGLAMGGVCATAAFSAGILKFTSVTLIWVLLNRTVMGAVIGTSSLRLHWAWNGIVLGLVVGSVFSYYLFMNVPGPLPAINAIANGVFGLIIEFFTTVVFKQPSLARARLLRAS
jgi:hypothetical protein